MPLASTSHGARTQAMSVSGNGNPLCIRGLFTMPHRGTMPGMAVAAAPIGGEAAPARAHKPSSVPALSSPGPRVSKGHRPYLSLVPNRRLQRGVYWEVLMRRGGLRWAPPTPSTPPE